MLQGVDELSFCHFNPQNAKSPENARDEDSKITLNYYEDSKSSLIYIFGALGLCGRSSYRSEQDGIHRPPPYLKFTHYKTYKPHRVDDCN